MKTGFRGAFVISWSQTEIDGLEDAPISSIAVGAAWSWRGDVVRVDGPSNILKLDRALGTDQLRRRAARKVRCIVGAAMQPSSAVPNDEDASHLRDAYFVMTDGAQTYTATLIDVDAQSRPLILFIDELPPWDTDLWVVRHTLAEETRRKVVPERAGVICFTPGTRIDTPSGPKPIETLRESELVLTRDNGPQEILWVGSRRMSGARLFAMPELRPIRFRVGALGVERPDQELLVSPEHRMLIDSRRARSVFNEPEVLIAARDLVDDKAITVDHALREVTYVHLLLAQHQIISANGVLTESFHPASASFDTLDAEDRRRLLARAPYLENDPLGYGAFARRNLTTSEAAILYNAA